MRMKKTVRPKKSARPEESSRFAGAAGTWAIVLVVMCVTGAAMLITAGEPSQTSDTTRAAARPERAAQPSTPPADASAMSVPTIAPTAKTAQKSAPVTITGCLERDDQIFRLKNAAGADAPKSRSWKSGFLKKGPTSIEVVDARHSLKLPSHVGQQVSVTGVIVEREIQAGSLRRVAATCNSSPKILAH